MAFNLFVANKMGIQSVLLRKMLIRNQQIKFLKNKENIVFEKQKIQITHLIETGFCTPFVLREVPAPLKYFKGGGGFNLFVANKMGIQSVLLRKMLIRNQQIKFLKNKENIVGI